jgi:hypothetical protein
MYVSVVIFQKGIIRKIHCYCIDDGINNLKKVYSLHHSTSTMISHGIKHE